MIKVSECRSQLVSLYLQLDNSVISYCNLQSLFLNIIVDNLKENAFRGEKIEKRLIPKEYIQKYDLDNLWRFSLPEGWRLVYSIATNDSEFVAFIIEYFNHKNYAKRFGYKH